MQRITAIATSLVAASFASKASAGIIATEAPVNSSFTTPLTAIGNGPLGQINAWWVPGDVNSAFRVTLDNNAATITDPAQIQFGSSSVNGFTVVVVNAANNQPVAYANLNATFNSISMNDPVFASILGQGAQTLNLVFLAPGAVSRNASNQSIDVLSGGGLFAPGFGGAIDNIIVGGASQTNTVRNYTVNFVNTDQQSFSVVPTPTAVALLGLGGLAAARRRR